MSQALKEFFFNPCMVCFVVEFNLQLINEKYHERWKSGDKKGKVSQLESLNLKGFFCGLPCLDVLMLVERDIFKKTN